VTTFPALEAALEEAAHWHYGRRRRPFRSWRLAVPAVAAALAASAAVIALPDEPAPRPERPAPNAIPAATLERSRALTRAPDVSWDSTEVVTHDELARVAESYELQTPYPPGGRDTFDWAATPSDPLNMASISRRLEVQRLVEFRASCIWQAYWLAVEAPAARRAAAAVLADVARWPTWRRPSSAARAERVAASAARGDGATIAENYRGDCSGMQSPWS
jgi:hypothetical protein